MIFLSIQHVERNQTIYQILPFSEDRFVNQEIVQTLIYRLLTPKGKRIILGKAVRLFGFIMMNL